MMVWKMMFLSQGCILRCHVSFREGIWSYPSTYQSFFPRQFEVWLLVLPKRWESGPWWWWRCCYQLDRCGFLVLFLWPFVPVIQVVFVRVWLVLFSWQMFSGVVFNHIILILFHMIFYHIWLFDMKSSDYWYIYIYISYLFFEPGFHQIVDVHPWTLTGSESC